MIDQMEIDITTWGKIEQKITLLLEEDKKCKKRVRP